MKFTFDHDYHIHSQLSSCSSDPRQTAQAILQYAIDRGLKKICITDHYWDENVDGASGWYKPQNFEHISKIKPLPQADGIEFLFGCETDMDKFFNVGISKETCDRFDFIIVPTTHMHMVGFTLAEEDDTIERKAKLWIERLDALLDKDLPFEKIGIAHLNCGLMHKKDRAEFIRMLNLIPQSEMERVFTRVAQKGCGVELNQDDVRLSDENEIEPILRIYKTAKKCGCKFYLGSDAHYPSHFESTTPIFTRVIDLLGLTEDDKFHIGKK